MFIDSEIVCVFVFFKIVGIKIGRNQIGLDGKEWTSIHKILHFLFAFVNKISAQNLWQFVPKIEFLCDLCKNIQIKNNQANEFEISEICGKGEHVNVKGTTSTLKLKHSSE